MNPGRCSPVGHQVGDHLLYNYLEEFDLSLLDVGRSSLTDLGSGLNPHYQCKIRLPTQVYRVVYEILGYISR